MVQAVAKVVAAPLSDSSGSSSGNGGAGGLSKETLLGGRLKHPHLVTILDCATVAGQVRLIYLYMFVYLYVVDDGGVDCHEYLSCEQYCGPR